MEIIGKGTFGEILRCLDHATNQEVAIKVFKNPDNKAIRTEIKLLEVINSRESDNVIKLLKAFVFRGHFFIV